MNQFFHLQHAVWWGPDVVLIYNDAYREMAGTKHPQIFAQRGSVSWGELWESIGPLVKKVFAGEPVYRRDGKGPLLSRAE